MASSSRLRHAASCTETALYRRAPDKHCGALLFCKNPPYSRLESRPGSAMCQVWPLRLRRGCRATSCVGRPAARSASENSTSDTAVAAEENTAKLVTPYMS